MVSLLRKGSTCFFVSFFPRRDINAGAGHAARRYCRRSDNRDRAAAAADGARVELAGAVCALPRARHGVGGHRRALRTAGLVGWLVGWSARLPLRWARRRGMWPRTCPSGCYTVAVMQRGLRRTGWLAGWRTDGRNRSQCLFGSVPADGAAREGAARLPARTRSTATWRGTPRCGCRR